MFSQWILADRPKRRNAAVPQGRYESNGTVRKTEKPHWDR